MDKDKYRDLHNIDVTPLASESFGVRSMCTFIKTPDVTLLLDAGVSLCPWRFNLPPHPTEYRTIMRLRRKIEEAADKASVVTVSHYHYDHHTPSFTDYVVNWTEDAESAKRIYLNKTVLAKDPKKNINSSQRERAYNFMQSAAKTAKTVEAADGKTFHFGGTEVAFSEAIAHGSDDHSLGWVTICTVTCEEERFMFAPDVQGPISLYTTEQILKAKPDLLMVGGPPLYLEGTRVAERAIRQATLNIERIAEAVPTIILEHHALRDELWRQKLDAVFVKAETAGHKVLTAAEYTGEGNNFLESKRHMLYEAEPPSSDFLQWTKTLNGGNISKPPI